MDYFSGSTAMITGASSGLGREFARQLAPFARTLILVARRQDRLEQLQAELARPRLEVLCRACDLADAGPREALLAELTARGERITLLVNNAGLGDHGFFDQSDWPRVQAMLEVNIHALTRLTHALLPQLLASPRAAIINVSSIASLLPLPKMAVYAASKAYVTSFSEALRAELRDTHVRVTALCPGPVETEFSKIAERPDARERMPAPAAFKVPAEQVVREGLAAVARDRARVIPGWLVCIVMTIAAAVPMLILRPVLREHWRAGAGPQQ